MISPISLGCQVEAAWTATIPKDLFMLERGNGRNPSQAYPDYLGLDSSLPLEIKTWNSELDSALFAARVATVTAMRDGARRRWKEYHTKGGWVLRCLPLRMPKRKLG